MRTRAWGIALLSQGLTLSAFAQEAPSATAETGAGDEATREESSSESEAPVAGSDDSGSESASAAPDQTAALDQTAAPEAASSPAVLDEEAASPAPSKDVTDAELERYLSEEQLGEGGFNPTLKLYGFADFTYSQYLMEADSPWRLLFSEGGNFAVGNLNLYLDSQLHETVRALAEVRFTYLPHGTLNLGPPSSRESNSMSDYTRNERDVDVGGISIERAWIQWSPHELFSIKAGHWLTPYGIWNVDHGTPTIVPVTRPFMIDEELLPESQSGLLAEGRLGINDALALEYGFGFSNGRGPTDTVFDQNGNKGLTYRLKLVHSGAGDFQIGASGYHGKYTSAQTDLTIVDDEIKSVELIGTEFKEVAWAADVRYQRGGLLLQAEAMVNDRHYTEEGRPGSYQANSLAPDSRRWGVYGITGYRFDWLGVMPYIIGEFSPIPDTSIYELPREILLLGGGLNIRPIAQVAIKLGYDQAIFPEARPTTFEQANIRRIQGQVAWAF